MFFFSCSKKHQIIDRNRQSASGIKIIKDTSEKQLEKDKADLLIASTQLQKLIDENTLLHHNLENEGPEGVNLDNNYIINAISVLKRLTPVVKAINDLENSQYKNETDQTLQQTFSETDQALKILDDFADAVHIRNYDFSEDDSIVKVEIDLDTGRPIEEKMALFTNAAKQEEINNKILSAYMNKGRNYHYTYYPLDRNAYTIFTFQNHNATRLQQIDTYINLLYGILSENIRYNKMHQ
jgi:hypothetical protein